MRECCRFEAGRQIPQSAHLQVELAVQYTFLDFYAFLPNGACCLFLPSFRAAPSLNNNVFEERASRATEYCSRVDFEVATKVGTKVVVHANWNFGCDPKSLT
jgi:hypothetical protein